MVSYGPKLGRAGTAASLTLTHAFGEGTTTTKGVALTKGTMASTTKGFASHAEHEDRSRQPRRCNGRRETRFH